MTSLESQALEYWQDRCKDLEEENKNLKSDLEQFSGAYKRYRDFEKEELADSCYDLEKENKKLKEDLENMRDYCSNLDSENDEQALEIEDLKREIEKLKETIKDHQLYEEKLEHRIIEFEELLHWE